MRTRAPIILFAAALAAAPAAAGTGPAPADPFARIGPDYKKPQELTEGFFNPFRVEATSEMSLQRKGGPVSNDAVDAAIVHRGVSGIILGTDPASNQAIIGDQVFRIGDELSFPDGDKGSTPLVPGVSVVLSGIDKDILSLEVISEGEALRKASFSLKSFWRP